MVAEVTRLALGKSSMISTVGEKGNGLQERDCEVQAGRRDVSEP